MGGGGGLEKKEKEKVGEAPRKTKGVVLGGSKGSSLEARGSLSRTFWCVGSVFQFFGPSEVSSTKTFVFFGSSKTLFYFFNSKGLLSISLFSVLLSKKYGDAQKGGPK